MESDGACSHMSEFRSIDQTPKANPFLGKFEQHSHDELYSWRHKRMKINNEGKDTIGTSYVASLYAGPKYNEDKTTPKVVDNSDPFSVPNLKEELDHGIYGSVTKDIEALRIRKMQMLTSLSAMYPSFSSPIVPSTPQSSRAGFDAFDLLNGQSKESQNIVDLDDDCFVIEDPSIEDSGSLHKSCIKEMQLHAGQRHLCVPGRDSPTGNKKTQVSVSVIILDSDEEDGKDRTGTGQTLSSNLEASNSDVPLGPQIQNFYNLRKRTNLTSHSKALFHEVRYSQEGTEEHGFTKEVKSTAVEENQNASDQYQEDISKNPIKGLAAGNCGKSKLASQEKISLDGETTSRKEKSLYVGVQDGLVSKEKNLQSDDGLVHCHHIQAGNCGKSKFTHQEKISLDGETTTRKEKGLYVGVQDLVSEEKNLQSGSGDDGLANIWGEMALALELSKDAVAASKNVEYNGGEEGGECGHSFVLKDDLGYVCRVCGVVEKSIEMIFEYQWIKGTRTTRTYMSGSQSIKDRDQTEVFPGLNVSEDDLTVAGISVHPMHMKQMKPHQLEGFNFLINNLVTDKPGGCILAHAPGSGKTFMIISFVQSYLAKYPNARPLVILPKSIMTTWKKEFEKWQVEDIPLYDFYSVKAENRGQQLDVLKNWVKHKSVLFLGYKQFANIICGSAKCPITASCHDILLKVPTILIMDEGHTPRNEDTNVLYSLAKVETPLKVVLSGTLYQNHVKEVFNILNLVRPKFLKLDTSREVIRRVLSKVQISGRRRKLKTGVDTPFFDLVEETLQNDEDFKRKVTVIQDLREMTKKVLHYYKGDFLEELPGLVDYTILLNLSTKQKQEAEKLKKLEKFKRSSMGSSIYIHPQLKDFSENGIMGDKGGNFNEDKMDELLNKLDVNDGVKTKFFLSLLCLCESAGEKLLVFSHYLLPLKFLERLAVKTKGWVSGKEIFMISGDSSTEHREWSMENFNISPNAKIFFGSIKACGEGISLVGASRILILDVHLNPSVTRQAIGRAFRPGQVRKVYTYRLVAADSPEEEDHNTCFRKELISKMWFEWSEYCGHQYFEMQTVSVKDCNDLFLESPLLGEDVKILYKR